MMNKFTLRKFLPKALIPPLFGDREAFGLVPDTSDPDWHEWGDTYQTFYESQQKQGVGAVVNEAGYKVLNEIPMSGKTVLEIGPGWLPHRQHWNGQPDEFLFAEIDPAMKAKTCEVLGESGVSYKSLDVNSRSFAEVDLPDESVDLIISFYALEHLNPLSGFIAEYHRVLKPGGQFAGAIPAEGGMAWGLGRFCTSRRWMLKNSNINPDKIICWEHPNFGDQIIEDLEAVFEREKLSFWPLGMPVLDANLVVKFIYRKS